MESIFSIIFAFLVEAIILLQYASRLFLRNAPCPTGLSCWAFCIPACVPQPFLTSNGWICFCICLLIFCFWSHNTMSNGAQLPSIPHCSLLSWGCASWSYIVSSPGPLPILYADGFASQYDSFILCSKISFLQSFICLRICSKVCRKQRIPTITLFCCWWSFPSHRYSSCLLLWE